MTGSGGADPWGSDSDADRTGMSEHLLAALAAHPNDMMDLVDALSPRVDGLEALVDLMQRASEQAVRLLDIVRWAGVTAQFDGAPFTCAHTHDRVLVLDEQQYRGGDGPCLRALRSGRTVQSDLAELHRRWPLLGAAAGAMGVRAVLALPLRAGAVPAAALNLYCADVPQPGVIDADVLTVLVQYLQRGLDDYLTASPGDTGNVQLRQALYTRNVIGRAQGMVMVSHGLGAVAALDVLVGEAERRQLPLWRYADELTREGRD